MKDQIEVNMKNRMDVNMEVDTEDKTEGTMEADMEEAIEMNIKDKSSDESIKNLNASLDSTQKNAINIEDLVTQVLLLSEHVTYSQIITKILSDESLSWEKRIEMIQDITDDYDQREERNTQRVKDLQSTQTKNVGAITAWLLNHWYIAPAGAMLLFGVKNPAVKTAISSLKSRLPSIA